MDPIQSELTAAFSTMESLVPTPGDYFSAAFEIRSIGPGDRAGYWVLYSGTTGNCEGRTLDQAMAVFRSKLEPVSLREKAKQLRAEAEALEAKAGQLNTQPERKQ